MAEAWAWQLAHGRAALPVQRPCTVQPVDLGSQSTRRAWGQNQLSRGDSTSMAPPGPGCGLRPGPCLWGCDVRQVAGVSARALSGLTCTFLRRTCTSLLTLDPAEAPGGLAPMPLGHLRFAHQPLVRQAGRLGSAVSVH